MRRSSPQCFKHQWGTRFPEKGVTPACRWKWEPGLENPQHSGLVAGALGWSHKGPREYANHEGRCHTRYGDSVFLVKLLLHGEEKNFNLRRQVSFGTIVKPSTGQCTWDIYPRRVGASTPEKHWQPGGGVKCGAHTWTPDVETGWL